MEKPNNDGPTSLRLSETRRQNLRLALEERAIFLRKWGGPPVDKASVAAMLMELGPEDEDEGG